jgi:hypothetical protein
MAETKPDELTETALAMLAAPLGDTWAVVEYLAAHTDALTAAQRCGELMRQLYAKKDLPRSVAIGRAGVQFGLAGAARVADPKQVDALRSAAKTIAYNLAANTWPGWDEQGISITAADLAVGRDAARTNLRLARELNKGDIPTSRAHWLLGAHQLAAGDRASARNSFVQASRHARAAKELGETLSNDAFAQLCDVLDAPHDAGAKERLSKTLEALRREKDGDFFASQVETARRVFGPK